MTRNRKIKTISFGLFRNENELFIHLSLVLSCVLLLLRVIYSETGQFIFLSWNLFLAYIPYTISTVFFSRVTVLENRYLFFPLLAIWILMIPNTFYIITDLYHLHRFSGVPQWFDLLLIFSFAWNGLLLGVQSVYKIEIILRIHFSTSITNMLLVCIMWLNAFGVYIGRYLRFNSWDLFSHPVSVISEIGIVFLNPVDNKGSIVMTFFFGLLLYCIYSTLKPVSRNLAA